MKPRIRCICWTVHNCHRLTRVHIWIMCFENTYNAVFLVYRVLGLVPFPFHLKSITNPPGTIPSNQQQKWNILIEILCFICIFSLELCILIFKCMTCYKDSLTHGLNLINASHMAIVFTVRAIAIVGTVETYLKRNSQVKILTNLYEIDRFFV